MSIKNKAKKAIGKKVKKILMMVLKPLLPYVAIVLIVLLLISWLMDGLFASSAQADDSELSEVQLDVKTMCIEKAEYLNTCDIYVDKEKKNELLDVNNLENTKMIEWSHLSTLMTLENLNNKKEIGQSLLNEIGENFKSTFRYEKDTIKTEEKQTKGDKVTWKEKKDEAQTQYILVESDTIIGHYTYEYETVTEVSDDGNTRVTKKKYKTENLQGEQYERLKDYLKTSMNLETDDIDMCVDLVIQSSSGYYDDTINNAYNILIGNDMFTWPIPGYTNVTSEYGYRVHPISGEYKLHSGVDVGAPVGTSFVAMADGIVTKASYNGGYGNCVIIDHGNGVTTLYAHGTNLLVKTNDRVTKGQPVLTVRKYWEFYRTTCTF